MAHPNNIIHRRRQARNAVKDARHAAATGGDAPVEKPAHGKKRVWRRKKKS